MNPVHEQVVLESRAQWRRWLIENHATVTGVWAVTWKKATGRPAPSYEDLVEEAVCVGWVDSMRRALDEGRSQLLFTPRRVRSPWAASNVARVARLTRAGLMLPAGLAAVEAAKADGRWPVADPDDEAGGQPPLSTVNV